METGQTPTIPDTTAERLRTCADAVVDDEYMWLGYEAAHPVPALFVLPIEDGVGARAAR